MCRQYENSITVTVVLQSSTKTSKILVISISIFFKHIALSTIKALRIYVRSECNRVKKLLHVCLLDYLQIY